jgi:hypothetical protein
MTLLFIGVDIVWSPDLAAEYDGRVDPDDFDDGAYGREYAHSDGHGEQSACE